MERLYVAKTRDSSSIYHRPTFQYIESCDNKILKAKLKELLGMNTEEFYRYLKGKGVRLQSKKQYDFNQKDDGDNEKWYQGAWKFVTDKLLKDYKLKMIDEEIPYDFIEVLLNENKTGWSVNTYKDKEEEFSLDMDLDLHFEEKEDLKPLKKVTKNKDKPKPVKHNNKKNKKIRKRTKK